MKKNRASLVILAVLAFFVSCPCSAAEQPEEPSSPLPVKVLLLPKFEVGELCGDDPGEAQYYFEHYLAGGEAYDVPNSSCALYYKDGVALCLLGMGKVSAALNTAAVLSDSRFDFSQAYIISTGCCGSAYGSTVMGDVFIISTVVDYDLGHHMDAREIEDPDGTTWFHDVNYDSYAVVRLDPELTDRVYALVKETPLHTTEVTRAYMLAVFNGEDWAGRDPQVLRGTSVTADNYWKGIYGHENALLMAETYQCTDPYTATEMEDVAVARAVRQMGLLDRLIIIRDSVNMDVYMPGVTPESFWSGDEPHTLRGDDNVESADIFFTAMKNNFDVGRIITDRILEGRF
ncbi:MAG: hypothetical protein IJI61_06720 [Oscillospiraceae bacterium]|nr:hypothetical protein [Oscillospiraceae bacterium]